MAAAMVKGALTAIPPARILVVDDDAGIRFYLEETLRRDGHQVEPFESGEAALEAISAREFDLALIDLKLRGIGGLKVLAALRQQWPDTIVIMLTAHASLETAVEALRQGAHDYLFKPSKTAELRESVRTGLLKRQQARQQRELLAQAERLDGREPANGVRLRPAPAPLGLSEAAGESRQPLQCGAFCVDFERHLITLDAKALDLSPTEFGLLAYLVGQAPRVISAQELAREVQGYDIEAWQANDTVRYHVYRIRQKVQAATSRLDVIRTVRGVGYAIEA